MHSSGFYEIMQSMESSKRLQVILSVLVVIFGMVISFYMGVHYGKTQATPSGNQTEQSQTKPENQANNQANNPAGAQDTPVFDANLVAGKDYAPTHPDERAREVIAKEIKRDPQDPRSLGSPDAPVVLVSYEDFSCPMCGVFYNRTHPELVKLVEAGKLRIEFRDLVIFPNYNSQLAHQGSRAAAQQGKFWEFVHEAFALSANGGHPEYTKELVLELAQKAGVPNLSAFEKALESEELVNAVRDETTHARQDLGLTGTPFFIVNQAVISGAQPTEFFVNTINQQSVEVK